MRGHVRRRGDTWSYVIDLGRQEGKRRQKWVGGFRTQKEAQKELNRVLRDLDTGADPFPEKISTADYLKRWLDHQATQLRPRVLVGYQRMVRLHILPVLGEVALDRVRPAHVQTVLDAAAASGLAPRSQVQVRAILSSALRTAVAWGLIPYNPVAAVRPPRTERPELIVPTAAQLVALVEAARGTSWEPAVLLAAATGARRSEILALRWSDVDFAARRVHITRGLHRMNRQGGGSDLRFSDPKTKRARRQVALPPWTVEALRRWRQSQLERRLVIGPAWGDGDLICDRGDGGPCDPDSFTRAFARLAARAGLPEGVRLHDMRHGVATVLFEQGVHPAIVSATLGHASEAFTMAVYTHVADRMGDVAADALERALGGER